MEVYISGMHFLWQLMFKDPSVLYIISFCYTHAFAAARNPTLGTILYY